MAVLIRAALAGLAFAVAGCATKPPETPPVVTPAPALVAVALPVPPAADSFMLAVPPSGKPDPRAQIARLLPPGVRDRLGWATDLQTAFGHLGLPQVPPVYCAAIAVIEQESGFQADPRVPGLPAIVRRELASRAARYAVPQLLVSTALQKTSPDGRTYHQRIAALQTEKQLNALFEDMVAELPAGRRLFADRNPVRTAGPMQVSIAFAETQVRERRYPYPVVRSIRDEVFTRRGGVYFGSAILLDYPAPYDEVVYRFADFNAGRYSSRNAAFQQVLGRLAGRPLATDGDLLRYRDGQPEALPSAVEKALRGLSGKLRLNSAEIRRDLLQEKADGFARTPLYQRLYALADRLGRPAPRQAMPKIDLKSPKITRQLTTEWFARRVEGRYRDCLGRV